MKELKLINPEGVSEEEVKGYDVREAARAVVFDNEGRVALLHVAKDEYYKLPGGGLDSGEDPVTALRRECQEEIGCDVEVIKEIGVITEYRKMFNLKQISYCYLANVKGEKRPPKFTEKETTQGFAPTWLSYEDAQRAVAGSAARSYEGKMYITPRDVMILAEANVFFKNRMVG